MTMLGIPEIDEVICEQLEVGDLARCSRVSSQWHRIVTPYVWRNLVYLCIDRVAFSFARIIREDYLKQQQQQQQQQQAVGAQDPPQPSMLVKYCPWIRIMPHLMYLLEIFQPPIILVEQGLKANQDAEPTGLDLLRHFLSHCSDLNMSSLCLNCDYYESESLLEIVTEFVLPHLRILDLGEIGNHIRDIRGCVTPRKIKHLLSRCSIRLEKLYVSSDIFDIEEDVEEGTNDQECEAQEPSFELKELNIEYYKEIPELSELWSWLWSRCCRLERLHVSETEGIVNCLANGMLAHMPNLCKIHLGNSTTNSSGTYPRPLEDEEIATLLSCCRNRWKVVDIGHNYTFQEASILALEQHYPTLEALVVREGDFMSKDLLLLLSSAPNLQTLVAIDDGCYYEPLYISIDAAMFIDLEPGTNSFRPWACEHTLKELKIKITDIPRPDLRDRRGAVEEEYAGQGKDIQNRVYERLARFTKLEKLWLGSSPVIEPRFHGSGARREQRDCLEMSLESGLHRLAGLKEMRELSVANTNSKIGLKEVQWMAENWPKLRMIRRLKGAEKKEKRKPYCASQDSFSSDESEYDEDEDEEACKEYLEILEWSKKEAPSLDVVGSCHRFYDNYERL